jgi:hypothetical protein
MAVETHILETAADMVNRAQHRADSLRDELDQLEKRKVGLTAELSAAELMAARLSNFTPHIGGRYHCPRCWIEEEELNPLALKKGGEWKQDFLMCDFCALEIVVVAK